MSHSYSNTNSRTDKTLAGGMVQLASVDAVAALTYNSSTSKWQLRLITGSSGNRTISTVWSGSWASVAGDTYSATLVRDASDNLYAVGVSPTTATNLTVRCWLWDKVNQTYSTTYVQELTTFANPAAPVAATWCATYGGAGGMGHLVVSARNSSNQAPQLWSIEAGVVAQNLSTLAIVSTVNAVTVPAQYLVTNPGFTPATVVQPTFGGTSGAVVTATTGGVITRPWTITGNGVLTSPTAYTVSGISVLDDTTANDSRLVVLGLGGTTYAVVGTQAATKTTFAAALFDQDGTTTVAASSPGAIAGIVSANTGVWSAFREPARDLVRIVQVSGTTLSSIDLPTTTSSLSWPAALTTVTTSFGAGTWAQLEVPRNHLARKRLDAYAQNTVPTSYGYGVTTNQAPNAPTLGAPAAGTYLDPRNEDTTFTWTPSDPDAGDTVTGWALRRNRSGSVAYEWWSAASSAWSPTLVINPGSLATTTVTAATADWTAGVTYEWSVATQDGESVLGSYAAGRAFTVASRPIVTTTLPASPTTVTNPTVGWAYSGTTQAYYRVKIFNESQWSAYGFDPDASSADWDSGEVASASTSAVSTGLVNGGYYRAYAKAGPQTTWYSAWSYVEFRVSVNGPAAPTVAVVGDNTNAKATITISGRDNFLAAQDASLEAAGVGGWAAVTNCSVARSTAQAQDGIASLATTATAGGTMSARATSGTLAPVTAPGAIVTAMAMVRPTASRTCNLRVRWFTSAGATISDSNAAGGTCAANIWTTLSGSVTAPAGAAYMTVLVEVVSAAASEVAYWDKLGIFPGASFPTASWSVGFSGGIADARYQLERSINGGTTWTAVRNASALSPTTPSSQTTVVTDYELPSGVAVQYRASTWSEV